MGGGTWEADIFYRTFRVQILWICLNLSLQYIAREVYRVGILILYRDPVI